MRSWFESSRCEVQKSIFPAMSHGMRNSSGLPPWPMRSGTSNSGNAAAISSSEGRPARFSGSVSVCVIDKVFNYVSEQGKHTSPDYRKVSGKW